MHTAAAGVMAKPSMLGQVWNVQRPKIIAAALALLIGAVLFLVFDTDFFYIFNLQVTGTRYLTSAEVEKASGVVNYNIFFVDARAVEQALAKLPEVKSVRVTSRIPNQVSVDIEERKPEITWLRGNEMYWVDASGIGFRARANLAELSVVRDLDQNPVKPGQRFQPDAVAAYWAYRAAFPDGPRSLEWSAARGLMFVDEHGWRIYLGGADEMAGKIVKLRALVPQLVARNARIAFIDLGRGDPYYQ